MSPRAFHTSRSSHQQAAATAAPDAHQPPPPSMGGVHAHTFLKTGGIREQLRQWQELHGKDLDAKYKALEQVSDPDVGSASNNLTRLPDPSISLREEAEREEEEQRSIAHFSRTPELDDGSNVDNRFLMMGDLVELEFMKSERESIIAVFVRRGYAGAQVYTMHGRWMFTPERSIQYSIPGWVSPKLVEPLLEHLPDPQTMEELDELADSAYHEDLSVPRAVAVPLVNRMVQFHSESLEVYRKHSGALDNAHNLLAHETDLRYGSLMSAATTLLKTPGGKLPVTALFTVRKALKHAGFAFAIDPRSHRLTGYMQIRSKEQCKTVETVREWLREWQDDLAVRASWDADDDRAARRHKTKRGAEIVYSFLDKAKSIILASRQDREPTICGNIGPSKKRFPIAAASDAVRTHVDEQFDSNDTELVRFVEAWACHNMYLGLPRLESLPPLLLQATGLYENHDLRTSTGFVFLQEIGTIMPYENRVRSDQHLLLPSSQHSKPLQNLMTSLSRMADNHNFVDSMADLRHDWGDLPVFCIDDASAHEIDDGLSIESAGDGQWWVHIHIANPTAFFTRDHPLAKMARHMGESIYMPERAYMMLPRWATKRHFSLDNNRPALTFSVRMDSEGRPVEHKVRPGFVRNVLRLTHSEVVDILASEHKTEDSQQMKTIVVGGEPPPPRQHKTRAGQVSPQMKDQLKTLSRLSAKRINLRKAAGGVFFDMHHPKVEVYQNARGPGLAWDHPYRKGSRTTEGDPVIRLSSMGLKNWFAPTEGVTEVLVREMMLLACETAAKWCAERKVPAIFRSVVPKPDMPDAEEFLQNVVLPAAAKHPNGEYPMHLGVQYIYTLGETKLTTKPRAHAILGLEAYGKVTSPLRRYGDMILHWQIEAALREEARTRKSLVTDNKNADRSFLPFSAPVLDTIMLGLQPREKIILRSKSYADQFWIAQLLFRAFHYGEAAIPWQPVSESPFDPPADIASGSLPSSSPAAMMPNMTSTRARPPPPPQNYNCHVMIASSNPQALESIGCQNIELNVPTSMQRPDKFGLGDVKSGDVWECSVLYVDVYRRTTFVRPVRLVHRAEC